MIDRETTIFDVLDQLENAMVVIKALPKRSAFDAGMWASRAIEVQSLINRIKREAGIPVPGEKSIS